MKGGFSCLEFEDQGMKGRHQFGPSGNYHYISNNRSESFNAFIGDARENIQDARKMTNEFIIRRSDDMRAEVTSPTHRVKWTPLPRGVRPRLSVPSGRPPNVSVVSERILVGCAVSACACVGVLRGFGSDACPGGLGRIVFSEEVRGVSFLVEAPDSVSRGFRGPGEGRLVLSSRPGWGDYFLVAAPIKTCQTSHL
ncbi:hypothetical protein QJS10_CPA08g00699 [Acorus calamus]|uniref:Uncharacterized protein n=1 Tax=Acorus calamus TaxID=4465 RepID=A0AAV9E9Q1_ACOCL|nr:hypothetical protein QJS10_CPA08g00699 [Acorus calamus]